MGSSKTKAVGGTPTAPLAKDFTNFLGGFINPQTGQPATTATPTWNGGSFTDLMNTAQSGGFKGVPSPNAGTGAVNSTTAFGSAIDSMLKGGTGTPNNLQDYFKTLNPMGTVPMAAPDFSNVQGQIIGNTPNFGMSNLNLPMINTQAGNVNMMQGFGAQPGAINTQASNPNLLQGFGSTPANVNAGAFNPMQFNPTNLDFSALQQGYNFNLPGMPDVSQLLQGQQLNLPNQPDFASILGGNNGFQLPGQVGNNLPGDIANRFASTNLSTLQANNPQVQAITDLINQQMGNQVNSLRERFTAEGGGSGRGTPGMMAEAALRAEMGPQLAVALGNLANQQAGLEMQAGALNQAGASSLAGILQNNRTQDITQRATDIGAQLQSMGIEAGQAQAMAQAMLQGRGQDIDASIQNAGLNQQGINTALNAMLGARGQDLQAATSGAQLGQQGNMAAVNAALQQAGLNADQISNLNNLMLQARGQDVTQGGMNAQNQLAGRQLDVSQLGMLADFMNQNRGMDINQQGQNVQNQLAGRQLDISQLGQMADFLNQNRGMDISQQGQNVQNLLTNRGMDINQMANLMQSQAANRGMDIQSFLGTQGQGIDMANMDLQAQLANAQNMLQGRQLDQSYNLGMQQLGQGFSQIQNQATMQAISELFNSMNQARQQGTTQAQLVQKPSGFQQALGGINAITGTIKGISDIFNPFSGGNGASQTTAASQMWNPGQPGYNAPMNMPAPQSAYPSFIPQSIPMSVLMRGF